MCPQILPALGYLAQPPRKSRWPGAAERDREWSAGLYSSKWPASRRFHTVGRMRTDKRTQVAITGPREAQRLAATLGGEIRAARRRRQMTIGELADPIGLHQARVGAIEPGGGLGAPLRVRGSLRVAVRPPPAIRLSR